MASGQYGSVSGGWCNVAGAGPAPACTVNTLSAMSVSGGFRNVASNAVASVSGGTGNTASGIDASVSGGENNAASAGGASVCGGGTNTASGSRASVSGGDGNTASGTGASVSGGSFNVANGLDTSVSGGPGLSASANYEWHSSRSASFPARRTESSFGAVVTSRRTSRTLPSDESVSNLNALPPALPHRVRRPLALHSTSAAPHSRWSRGHSCLRE